jgi:hypothetical protein
MYSKCVYTLVFARFLDRLISVTCWCCTHERRIVHHHRKKVILMGDGEMLGCFCVLHSQLCVQLTTQLAYYKPQSNRTLSPQVFRPKFGTHFPFLHSRYIETYGKFVRL